MNLYSSKEMTALLEKNNFFFKKNFGQNFLMNEAIAKRIATASLDSMQKNGKTLVLEIGPGAGALTLQLSSLFDQVIALEIDSHLIPVLDESLAECTNVRIIRTDALQFDYNTIAQEFPNWEIAVCSNLPYYITSELIMRLLECDLTISSITVLIQKEAANSRFFLHVRGDILPVSPAGASWKPHRPSAVLPCRRAGFFDKYGSVPVPPEPDDRLRLFRWRKWQAGPMR